MAPDLAVAELRRLKVPSLVLDPMAGSGTVVRQASELGHRAKGFDLDPLAVLMATVWTTPTDPTALERHCRRALDEVRATAAPDIRLSWIDEDEETRRFAEYWFADPQRSDLRRISHVLARLEGSRRSTGSKVAANVLRLALSRIIITKDQGASLARDVSHSRPHKVVEKSSFDVMPAFERSVRQVRQLLATAPPPGNAEIKVGDARALRSIDNESVDVVLTSPPYLNAIDYMRGHRLSLIWLGHRLADLRRIRANSIGAERGSDNRSAAPLFEDIQESMCDVGKLPGRHAAMIQRYAEDVYRFVSEVARVLRPGGRAILVVGNSCLKGVFIQNSNGVARAASMVGLKPTRKIERSLPVQHRYLPMPRSLDVPLGKRMRTETVLTFKRE
jgi:SAM-dependent methyltransferase